MNSFLLLISTIISIAIIAGTLEHNRDAKKIKEIARKTRSLGYRGIFAASVWIGLSLIFLTYGLTQIGIEIDQSKLSLLYIWISLSAFSLLFSEYELFRIFKDNWKTVSAIFGLIGVGTALLVSIFVDIEITSLTNLNASLFPNAQKTILLLLTPIFWFIALVFVASCFYVIHASVLLIKIIRSCKYLDGVFRSICLILRIKTSKNTMNPFHDFAILIGLLIFVISSPSILSNTVNIFNKVPELLLFSSYHSDSNSCTNVTGENTKVAFVKGKEISIAVLQDDQKYKFYVAECARPENFNTESLTTN